MSTRHRHPHWRAGHIYFHLYNSSRSLLVYFGLYPLSWQQLLREWQGISFVFFRCTERLSNLQLYQRFDLTSAVFSSSIKSMELEKKSLPLRGKYNGDLQVKHHRLRALGVNEGQAILGYYSGVSQCYRRVPRPQRLF